MTINQNTYYKFKVQFHIKLIVSEIMFYSLIYLNIIP